MRLRQIKIFLVALTLFLSCGANAQVIKKDRRNKPVLDYEVNFHYYFDNREFDRTNNKFTNSMTINATRINPAVGIKIRQDRRMEHNVMVGVDLIHNMGGNIIDNPEINLYYNLNLRSPKATLLFMPGFILAQKAKETMEKSFTRTLLDFTTTLSKVSFSNFIAQKPSMKLGLTGWGKLGTTDVSVL